MDRCLSILVKHGRSLMAAKTNRRWALSAFFSVVSSIAFGLTDNAPNFGMTFGLSGLFLGL